MRLAIPILVGSLLTACAGDATDIQLTTNETGSFDADWIGDGGSTSETLTWNNPFTFAEYAMDITAAPGGLFTVEITDADGAALDTLTLEAGVGDDSRDGIIGPGTAGDWTITLTIEDFSGDGTFDLGGMNADDI